MKQYLYITVGEDGCGDLYVSLRPLGDPGDFREVSLRELNDNCDPHMGRNESAKIKICIEGTNENH